MIPKRVPQDQLAREPGRVLEAVGAGNPVVIEATGRPAAAIVDLVDYQILLAVIHYYTQHPRIDPEAGLSDSQLTGLDEQSRYDIVVAHYLGEAVSLSRAAEVLGTYWLDLRARFSRLGIPIRTGPVDAEGARQDALVAESFAP